MTGRRRCRGSAVRGPAGRPIRPHRTGQRGTVLVTGATGFLGSSRSAACSPTGPGCACWRARREGRRGSPGGAEVIPGDITDRAAVRAAVTGADVVYHLAGRLFQPGVPASEYQRTSDRHRAAAVMLRRPGPPEAVRALQHHGRARGDRGFRPTSRRRSGRPTSMSRPRPKQSRRSWTRAGRWPPAIIARPGLVYGPGDLHLLPFFRTVVNGGSGPSAVSRSGCTRSTSTT